MQLEATSLPVNASVKVVIVVSKNTNIPNPMLSKWVLFSATISRPPFNLIVQAEGKINAMAEAARPPVKSNTTPRLQVDTPMIVVIVINATVVAMCRVFEILEFVSRPRPDLKRVFLAINSSRGYVRDMSSAKSNLAKLIITSVEGKQFRMFDRILSLKIT